MRIAVWQATGRLRARELNTGALESAARAAAARGAEVLVTPELFLASYSPAAVFSDDGEQDRAFLARLAARHRLWVAGSSVEQSAGGPSITASLFSSDGTETTRYRKRTLFGAAEKSRFVAGDALPETIDVNGWQAALGICFDVEFPEFVRSAALRGVELLLVPTAVPLRHGTAGRDDPLDTRLIPTMMVPTRALESQLYIAYANQSNPGFAGCSTIADPYGRRIAAAGARDALILADIDHASLSAARAAVEYLDTAWAFHDPASLSQTAPRAP